ncbi:hypothetical protein FEM48_Zijuj03G0018100 [Ziziphus jujuba var. spinosa]|uniref:Uncharacterized protein n=1 Tax=Ziziphus jujuba var. spinosa TaxID=714518 RepID=A0A978VMF9_ZIZJJ|nr:hypothetical protein FEM48_Zijuj03G0018100 [Ziziphus jujuba var. spinosa]
MEAVPTILLIQVLLENWDYQWKRVETCMSWLQMGYPVQADFYVLPVAACHAVLGVQWLVTLGPMEMDYRALTIKFTKDGMVYQLQGNKPEVLKN